MPKNVLITGVLGGIGSGLAKAFRENGYFVIGLDVKENPPDYCDKFISFDLNLFCCDSDYRLRLQALFDKEISSLDVLINNAAVQLLGGIEELTLDDWNHTLNVN